MEKVEKDRYAAQMKGKRYTFWIPDDLMDDVQRFRRENGVTTYSSVVRQLLRVGLESLKRYGGTGD